MSFVGNCGTFTRGYRAMVLDVEFLYHLLYLLICAMGLFVHEFFYSLLVSSWCGRILHVEHQECPVTCVSSQTPPFSGDWYVWSHRRSHASFWGSGEESSSGSRAASRREGGVGSWCTLDLLLVSGRQCLQSGSGDVPSIVSLSFFLGLSTY